jgi:hypothetical protein
MRYILDDRGYVKYCSNTYITCENKTCTPYEGTIPDGYETIEEWVQNANIRAYTVVDGNLVFDAEEDARLQEEYEELSKTYSTTEKVVGTWINGKPLYRKVVIIDTIGNNVNMEVPLNISNLGECWIDESSSFLGNDAETLGINWFYSTTDYIRTWINKSRGIRIKTPSSLSAFTGYITVNYTKTTD